MPTTDIEKLSQGEARPHGRPAAEVVPSQACRSYDQPGEAGDWNGLDNDAVLSTL